MDASDSGNCKPMNSSDSGNCKQGGHKTKYSESVFLDIYNRTLQGQRMSEISRALNIPSSTIRTRLKKMSKQRKSKEGSGKPSDSLIKNHQPYSSSHHLTNSLECKNQNITSVEVKDKRNFSTHNYSEHQGTSFLDVQDDTECLTILSSDEEESVNTKHQVADTTVIEKEPIITDIRSSVYDEAEDGADSEDTEFEVCGYDSINLSCRTVRIGSYKAIPRQDIIFSQRGIKIWVPHRNQSDSVLIKIPIRCIVKLLFHFGRSLPVIFIYTMPQIATNIRKLLRMNESNGHYFNPASRNEVFKRIILLPERVTEAMQNMLQDLFEGTDDLLQELTVKEANYILVRSSSAKVANFGSYQVNLSSIAMDSSDSGNCKPMNSSDSGNCKQGGHKPKYSESVLLDIYNRSLRGQRISEISRALNIPFSTIRTRLKKMSKQWKSKEGSGKPSDSLIKNHHPYSSSHHLTNSLECKNQNITSVENPVEMTSMPRHNNNGINNNRALDVCSKNETDNGHDIKTAHDRSKWRLKDQKLNENFV